MEKMPFFAPVCIESANRSGLDIEDLEPGEVVPVTVYGESVARDRDGFANR